MGIYHTRPIPFNFLNETGMRFVLNKRGGVGMGATRPEPAPLPFLKVGNNQTNPMEKVVDTFLGKATHGKEHVLIGCKQSSSHTPNHLHSYGYY